MKLREFLKKKIDINIKSFLTNKWIIRFAGPVELTKEGEVNYVSILDNEVHLKGPYEAEIEVDDEERDELVEALFYTAAGYCNFFDYRKYYFQ